MRPRHPFLPGQVVLTTCMLHCNIVASQYSERVVYRWLGYVCPTPLAWSFLGGRGRYCKNEKSEDRTTEAIGDKLRCVIGNDHV